MFYLQFTAISRKPSNSKYPPYLQIVHLKNILVDVEKKIILIIINYINNCAAFLKAKMRPVAHEVKRSNFLKVHATCS